MSFCSSCGSQISSNDDVCPKCAARVRRSAVASLKDMALIAWGPPSSRRRVCRFTFGAAVGALIVLGLGIIGLITVNSPSHRVRSDFNRAFDLLKAGDTEGARQYFDYDTLVSNVARHITGGSSDYASHLTARDPQVLFAASEMVSMTIMGTSVVLDQKRFFAELPPPIRYDKVVKVTTHGEKTARISFALRPKTEHSGNSIEITWEMVNRDRRWVITDITSFEMGGTKHW